MNLGSGPIEGDAFGQALLARQEGRVGDIVSERDDGLIELDPFDYFSPPQGPLWDWVVARVGHRILDIGAGTGRAALALQAMGRQVLALDVSPGAVEVCRRRGVASTFLGTVHELAATGPVPFDSFIAINSLSLVFNPTEAVDLLDAVRAMGHPDSALVGTIRIPTAPTSLSISRTKRPIGRPVEWAARSAGVLASSALPAPGTRSCGPAERSWPRWPAGWDGDWWRLPRQQMPSTAPCSGPSPGD